MEPMSNSPIEMTARVISCPEYGKLPPATQTGTVRLTEDDVSWASLTADLRLRFLLSDIVGTRGSTDKQSVRRVSPHFPNHTDLQKSPESQPNAKVRVLLSKDKASNVPLVFDFVTGSGAPDKVARESFIKIRNDLRSAAFAAVPGLSQVHGRVVNQDGVSEADFWRFHQQLLIDAGLGRRQVRLFRGREGGGGGRWRLVRSHSCLPLPLRSLP